MPSWQILISIGVPLLTCGATVVWQLAIMSRVREDVDQLKRDARDEQKAKASFGATLARIEERQEGLHDEIFRPREMRERGSRP